MGSVTGLPELLPCPFCGAGAGLIKPTRGSGVYVGCTSCQGSVFACVEPVSTDASKDAAIAAWNRRALAATPPCAEVAGLSDDELDALERIGGDATQPGDIQILRVFLRRLSTAPAAPPEGFVQVETIIAPALDPVRVMFFDEGPGAGRVIVECYGDAWAAYWGAMGDRTVRRFFQTSPTDYIASKFARSDELETRMVYINRIVAAIQAHLAAAPTPPKMEG